MAKSKVPDKENPKIVQRERKDGKTSLFLRYHLGSTRIPKTNEDGEILRYTEGKKAGTVIYEVHHVRPVEDLKLYLYSKPRTPEQRQHNADTWEIAKRIRYTKEQELVRDQMGYAIDTRRTDNIVKFFDHYCEDYTKHDLRNIQLSINRFKSFLREQYPMCCTRKSPTEIAKLEREWDEKHKKTPGHHPLNENERWEFRLKPSRMDRDMIKSFVEWLAEHGVGGGPLTAFKRFKKVVAYAVEKGVLHTNPCEGIRIAYDENKLVKDVLSAEEVTRLMNTTYQGQNQEVRRAFLFTLNTGIRFCDIKELRFSDIDYTNKTLSFDQIKTKGHSAHSRVDIPLRDDLLELVGTPEEHNREKDDLIFLLPSSTSCNKALGTWTRKAGIAKHITWHCGRHSFGTLVLEGGANVKVVADLMGHSSISMTERYVRARDEAKKRALETLPKIEVIKP